MVGPTALAVTAALALILGATPAGAEDVPMPRGTRPAADGVHQSGRSFRDTVDFFTRSLARRGVHHEAIGPYRRRGVTVMRFVASGRAPAVRAIHVWSTGGRTFIYVVPGDAAGAQQPAETLDRPAPAR